MDNSYAEKAEAQLHKKLRVGSEENADLMREHFGEAERALYDTDFMRKDISEIDSLLQNKNSNLTKEQRASLDAVQGRNLSSLLILSEKTLGDSKEMKAVKKGISEIERCLHKEKSTPFTPDNVDYLLNMYDRAILACNYYLDHKSPTFGTGKDRYRQVKYNMYRLMREASEFRIAKELLRSGVISEEKGNNTARTAHQLLVQAKLDKLTAGNAADAVPEVREPATDEQVRELGLYGEILYRALSGKEDPADLIARLENSDEDKELDFANQLPVVFTHMVTALRGFKEYKVSSQMYVFEDAVICLMQNAAGQVTLSVGNKSVPIERNSGVLADQLAINIVKNEETYGKKAVENIVQPLVSRDRETFLRDLPLNRQVITTYLSSKTGLAPSKFTNVRADKLREMLSCAYKGEARLKELVEKVEKDEDAEIMINGTETKELLKETQKAENRDAVKEKVTIEKKEQKREEDSWDENEEKIVNMISELIFSYDTWTADEKVKSPGERIKLVLKKHSDALCSLISDMYKNGGDRLKIVNGIVNRLPLFMLEKEEEVAQFRKMIATSIKNVMDSIDQKIAEKTQEMLPVVLENLAEIEERQKQRQKKQKELPKPDENAGGVLGFFGSLIGKGIAAGVDWVANKADQEMERRLKKVDTAEKIMQVAMDHLQNPQELKNGGGEFRLPSIIELIDGISDQEMAEEEKSIDDNVKEMTEKIQQTVSKYSEELFRHEPQAIEEDWPDPHANNLRDWEKRNAQRKLIKLGNKKLENKIKECISSGESGQGMFTKYVFKNYFKSVDMMDRRSMIASMIKNSKPVTEKFLDENEQGIDDNEQERRIAFNNSIRAKAMGNYLGGLLKGAGPLFQKMMQGLPTEGLPEEIKGAVEDMKSKLAPIPEEVVEAQLFAIVERSHGQIKNIRVVKPLGAASVGQTFLCKLTKADGKEEEVAVKLLKPDVRNRMMREKDIMIRCARETDIDSRKKENERRTKENEVRLRQGKKKIELLPKIEDGDKGGMQMTYEGQLERIEEELDLTIEARNVELGKVYDQFKDKKSSKAVSMKLNPIVAPTTNTMVLEKALGETIDSLLKRCRLEIDEMFDSYYMKDEKGKVITVKNEDGVYEPVLRAVDLNAVMDQFDENSELRMKNDPKNMIDKLYSMLANLQKKKEYLEAFSRKWVSEGIFKAGFYHGDPHAGNIMISDDKLTAIDFGNCTKLSEDQQYHITRMIFAATAGDMETFRSGFHALLNLRFESLYQEKRAELGQIITETFSYGDLSSAGSRIMVALLRAQELGLEVPAAVYNFSQGQTRLQNTVSDFNATIDHVKKRLEYISGFGKNKDSGFDFTDFLRNNNIDNPMYDQNLDGNRDGFAEDMLALTSSKATIAAFAYRHPQGMHEQIYNELDHGIGKVDDIVKDLDTKAKQYLTIPLNIRQTGNVKKFKSELYSYMRAVYKDEPQSYSLDEILSWVSTFLTDDVKQRLKDHERNVKQIGNNNPLDPIIADIEKEAENRRKSAQKDLSPAEWETVTKWESTWEYKFYSQNMLIGKGRVGEIVKLVLHGDYKVEDIDNIIKELKDSKTQAQDTLDKLALFEETYTNIVREHKSFSPTAEERAKYLKAASDLADAYFPLQQKNVKNYSLYVAAIDDLTSKSNRAALERDMQFFFKIHEYRKDEFMYAYTEFRNAQDRDAQINDPEEYKKLKQKLADIYHDVIQKYVTDKYKKADYIYEHPNKSFAEIMSDVIADEKLASLKRVGLIKGAIYKYKIDNLSDKESKLSSTEADDKASEELDKMGNA